MFQKNDNESPLKKFKTEVTQPKNDINLNLLGSKDREVIWIKDVNGNEEKNLIPNISI